MDTTDITLVNVSDGWKEVAATVHFRHYHTAAVTPSGLLLVGGYRVGTGVQGGQTLVTVWVQS